MNLKCSYDAPVLFVLVCSLCQLSQVTVHEEDGVQDSLTFQRLQIMLLEQFGKYVIDINFLFCHHGNKLSNFIMISYQGYPLHW